VFETGGPVLLFNQDKCTDALKAPADNKRDIVVSGFLKYPVLIAKEDFVLMHCSGIIRGLEWVTICPFQTHSYIP
jgi:hypothetical protein